MPLTVQAPFTCGGKSGADFGAQVSRPAPQVGYNAPAGGLSGVSMGMVVNTPLAVVIPFTPGGLSGAEFFPAQTEDYETWVLNDNGFRPGGLHELVFQFLRAVPRAILRRGRCRALPPGRAGSGWGEDSSGGAARSG